MSTSSSVAKPELEKDEEICNYKVIRKLGSGGFGSVYEVERDGKRAALKAEFIDPDGERTETLKNEVTHLRLLQRSEFFCRLLCACKLKIHDQWANIMVMSLVGKPLSRMRRTCPDQKFTLSTAIRLSKQCVMALRDLHQTGILHRDVKASNFAWSPDKHVYLLDLGFCRKFIVIKESGEAGYRDARKKAPFLGTSKYCSINVHNRIEQGRRDDLWGWLYMLIEFIKGRLIWRNDSDRTTAIKKEKIGSRLLNGCPFELYWILDHIRSLKRTSRPDYNQIVETIDAVCTRLHFLHDDPYDWEEKGAYFDCFEADDGTDMSSMSQSSLDSKIENEENKEINATNEEVLDAPSLPTATTTRSSSTSGTSLD